ncbi:protein DOG1-like 3 [Typha latifolia]|uniref:protein DOG1-like 3 n=1 Tax=Typha latifolia TaxID=4733 RepID=UPI003C2E54E2
MGYSKFRSTHDNWIQVQEADLTNLLQAKNSPLLPDQELRALVNKAMKHYEDYSSVRRDLAKEDPTTLFSPPWCASFENSFLYIGGCRPSLFIRLLYSLSGDSFESHLDDFLAGRLDARTQGLNGTMALSAGQLRQVNKLHCRVLKEEGKLSARLATLQEAVADKPLLPIAKERKRRAEQVAVCSSTSSSDDVGINVEVEKALESYDKGLGELLGEADVLRVATARELVEGVLSPKQAVDLLVAAKQLHLSIHEWGMGRDLQHRRG